VSGPYRVVYVNPKRAPDEWHVRGPVAHYWTYLDEQDAIRQCQDLNEAYLSGAEAERKATPDRPPTGEAGGGKA